MFPPRPLSPLSRVVQVHLRALPMGVAVALEIATVPPYTEDVVTIPCRLYQSLGSPRPAWNGIDTVTTSPPVLKL
jgi:hypothetical protein